MLGISVFLALRDAVAASANSKKIPKLNAPATPERILMAIEALKG
jgi:xanthine dehydrogenase large subunit